MERVYKYYEIAASEESYRVRSKTVAQNNKYLLLNYGLRVN